MSRVHVTSIEDRASVPIEAQLIDPLRGDEWDCLAASHPKFTVFHGSGWARVLHLTYQHEPFYLKIQRGEENIALIPMMQVSSAMTGRRGVCLPFSDFCSPLWWNQNEADQIQEALVNLALKQEWRYFELRGGESLMPVSQSHGAYLSHQLDLTNGIQFVQERMEASTRRCVRKAARCGLKVKVGSSLEYLEAYQQVHALTRKRHGVPPQPPVFFRNLQEELLDKGAGFVVLAYDQGNPVAGAVFFSSGKHAIYKFGASDVKYWGLRPNHLVMWTGIQQLVARGCRILDMGRTAISNIGLSRFKNSWGGRSAIVSYHRYGLNEGAWLSANNKGDEGSNIFRWMPKGMSRIAGRFLYPHLD